MTPGAKFRQDALKRYDFGAADPGAQQLLDSIVATLDEIALLEEAVKRDGVTVQGARGQVISHPALASLAKHRALLSRLIASLFPEGDRETTSQQAARAARERWKKARG